MAAITNTRELMLQLADSLVTLRAAKAIYSSTQPWTNLITQPGLAQVTNLTNPSVEILNPFGNLSLTTDFIKFVPSATNGEHKINEQNILSASTPFVSGQKIEQTVYVKDVVTGGIGSGQKINCRVATAGSGGARVLQYTFDPGIGKFIASTIGLGWTNTSAVASALDNNWWKVTITGTFTTVGVETTTAINSNWLITNSSSQTSYAGGAGLYLYGFQTYYGATLPDEVINDTWYDAVANTTKIWNGYSFITIGGTSTIYYITSTAPVIKKAAASAEAVGVYSSVTVQGNRTVGTSTSLHGYVTVTADADPESATAAAGAYTINTASTAGKSLYTVRLYDAAVAPRNLLDTEVIPVVFDGSNALSVNLTNDNCTVTAAVDGTVSTYANTNTSITVYEGATALTFDTTATTAGKYTIAVSPSGITAGARTGQGTTTAVVAVASAMTADTATVTYTIDGKTLNNVGFTLIATQTFSKARKGDVGADGTKFATVYLYKWSSAQPAKPTGSASTYTWLTKEHSAWVDNTNGWYKAIPVSPGTSGIKLWVASVDISANVSATSTTIADTTGTPKWADSVVALVNQASGYGSKAANAQVYQWASTTPTISGTSTYTWLSASLDAAPSGWSLTPGTSPTPGYNLYTATVNLLAAPAITTTIVNWVESSILITGYASPGIQGVSVRICYSRIANNPTPVSATVTTTGSTSFPTSVQSKTAWSPADTTFEVSWAATDPAPTSTNSLYQSDGLYNPATNNTIWAAPYISSLKVGSLSAVSANTGILTVDNTLTVGNTGKIRGGQSGYSDGNGFFLGYDVDKYKFSVGNSAGNQLTWNGTTLAIPAATVTGTLTSGQIATGAIKANHIAIAPKSLNLDPSFEGGSTWVGFVERLPRANAAVPANCPVAFASRFNQRDGMSSNTIEVVPGEVYRASCWVNRGTGSGGSGLGVVGYVYDSTGSVIAAFAWPGATTTAAGWVRVTGIYTIPATGARLSFGTWADRTAYTGEAWYADLNIEKVNDASLIVDGAITATKIETGLLQADNVLTRGLTVRNAAGTIILSSGVPLGAQNMSPVSTENLIVLPHTFSSNWIYGSGSLTNSGVEDRLGGTNGSRLTLTATPADLYRQMTGLKTGGTYRVNIWYKRETAGNFVITLNNGATWNTGESSANTGTGWNLASAKITTNTGNINIHIGAHSNTGTQQIAGTVLVSHIELVETSPFENTNITISTGIISGIGSGTGTAVDNTLVAGISLVNVSGITVSGNTAIKTGNSDATWDSSFVSKDSYTGGAYVSFVPQQTDKYLMIGLNTDPYANNSYTSIDYAMYCVADASLVAYESGGGTGTLGSYVAGDVLAVTYDGSTVRYVKNGSVIRAVAATITAPLFIDSSFHTLNAKVSNIQFGPMTSNAWASIGGTGKPEDNATVGAPTGTLVGGTAASNVAGASNGYNGQVKSFFVAGSQTSFYPVYIQSSVVATGCYYDFVVSRPDVHADSLNLGSYTCHVFARASAWGNVPGAVVEVDQVTGYGTYTSGVANINTNSTGNGIWLLMRGGMTHQISMSQPIGAYTVTVYAANQTEGNGNTINITSATTGGLLDYLNKAYCPAAPVDFSASVGGTTKPENNATVGASFGVNIGGQITSGNVSTYIESAAIGSAYIADLNANKLITRSITTDKIAVGAATSVISQSYISGVDLYNSTAVSQTSALNLFSSVTAPSITIEASSRVTITGSITISVYTNANAYREIIAAAVITLAGLAFYVTQTTYSYAGASSPCYITIPFCFTRVIDTAGSYTLSATVTANSRLSSLASVAITRVTRESGAWISLMDNKV